jgi:hypothetical protein
VQDVQKQILMGMKWMGGFFQVEWFFFPGRKHLLFFGRIGGPGRPKNNHYALGKH